MYYDGDNICVKVSATRLCAEPLIPASNSSELTEVVNPIIRSFLLLAYFASIAPLINLIEPIFIGAFPPNQLIN